MFDAWFLRDGFLRESFQELQAMLNEKTLSRGKNQQHLYLTDFYNVEGCYSKVKTLDFATAYIIKTLMDTLNENHRMPRFLVVVFNRDLIHNLMDIKKTNRR